MDFLFSRQVGLITLFGASTVCSLAVILGLFGALTLAVAMKVAVVAVAVIVGYMLLAIAYENSQLAKISSEDRRG